MLKMGVFSSCETFPKNSLRNVSSFFSSVISCSIKEGEETEDEAGSTVESLAKSGKSLRGVFDEAIPSFKARIASSNPDSNRDRNDSNVINVETKTATSETPMTVKET